MPHRHGGTWSSGTGSICNVPQYSGSSFVPSSQMPMVTCGVSRQSPNYWATGAAGPVPPTMNYSSWPHQALFNPAMTVPMMTTCSRTGPSVILNSFFLNTGAPQQPPSSYEKLLCYWGQPFAMPATHLSTTLESTHDAYHGVPLDHWQPLPSRNEVLSGTRILEWTTPSVTSDKYEQLSQSISTDVDTATAPSDVSTSSSTIHEAPLDSSSSVSSSSVNSATTSTTEDHELLNHKMEEEISAELLASKFGTVPSLSEEIGESLPSSNNERVLERRDGVNYRATDITSSSRIKKKNHYSRPRIHGCKFDGCSYISDRLCNLQDHERTHTGERPYICQFCPYASSNISNLRVHQRKHQMKRRQDKSDTHLATTADKPE